MRQLPSFDELLEMSDGEILKLRNEMIDEMLEDATPDRKAKIYEIQRKVGQVSFRNNGDHLATCIEVTLLAVKSLRDQTEKLIEVKKLCDQRKHNIKVI